MCDAKRIIPPVWKFYLVFAKFECKTSLCRDHILISLAFQSALCDVNNTLSCTQKQRSNALGGRNAQESLSTRRSPHYPHTGIRRGRAVPVVLLRSHRVESHPLLQSRPPARHFRTRRRLPRRIPRRCASCRDRNPGCAWIAPSRRRRRGHYRPSCGTHTHKHHTYTSHVPPFDPTARGAVSGIPPDRRGARQKARVGRRRTFRRSPTRDDVMMRCERRRSDSDGSD